MNNFRKYGTHLILSSNEEIPKPIIGKSFRISFRELETKIKNISIKKHEIIIEAKSIIRAQSACDLIICSLCVLEGDVLLGIRDISVYPLNRNNEEKSLYDGIVNEFSKPGLLLACKMAAKISFYRSYVNSVHKFLLSCEIFSTDWIDLDPTRRPVIPLSPFTYDHLKYGHAIVLTYSIIEELNLAVNASREKPSIINGKWNDVVKKDLEERLIKSNIDINEPILWDRRGSKKSLEKRRPILSLKKASWSHGPHIRDCEILLIDAINYISWLRSKIIVHKVDNDII